MRSWARRPDHAHPHRQQPAAHARRHRPAHHVGARERRACASRSPTSAPASSARSSTGSSSRSTPPTTPAAPGSASPSPTSSPSGCRRPARRKRPRAHHLRPGAARMTRRPVLAAVLVGAAVLPVAGCGGKSSTTTETSSQTTTTRIEVLKDSSKADGGAAFDPRGIYRRESPGVVTVIATGLKSDTGQGSADGPGLRVRHLRRRRDRDERARRDQRHRRRDQEGLRGVRALRRRQPGGRPGARLRPRSATSRC